MKKRITRILGTFVLERGNSKCKDPEACWRNTQRVSVACGAQMKEEQLEVGVAGSQIILDLVGQGKDLAHA